MLDRSKQWVWCEVIVWLCDTIYGETNRLPYPSCNQQNRIVSLHVEQQARLCRHRDNPTQCCAIFVDLLQLV